MLWLCNLFRLNTLDSGRHYHSQFGGCETQILFHRALLPEPSDTEWWVTHDKEKEPSELKSGSFILLQGESSDFIYHKYLVSV